MEFWAKTKPDGKPGISVFAHMLDVGCVARCLAEMSPEILSRFCLHAKEVGSLAALHDIGKISPGFQRKCEAWLEENSLSKVARNGVWDTGMESDHGKVSHAAVQQILVQKAFAGTTAKFLSAVLGAHHGRLNPPNDRGFVPQRGIRETASGIDWDAERITNAEKTWKYLGGCTPELDLDDESPALWWLAGLTTVADWIGSNERFFPPEGHDLGNVAGMAQKALDNIGFQKPQLVGNLSFHDLFHDLAHPEIIWTPNEMQEKTLAVVRGPGVYVVEAPMGMGKTEAALWAAYRLLVAGKANGIYFALPTQATSNRIHLRMNDFLRRIAPTAQGSRLIHGNSWLMDQESALSITATDATEKRTDDARIGVNWFASAKRALIAPFGVGTIDQALLGVVAAKHFFVRHFALAGKVVILDEIHSYDLYTGTLIDKLITTLEGLGCTVIVLSATLTGKRRENIVSSSDTWGEEETQPYPLITGRHEGALLPPASAAPPANRKVRVEFVNVDDAARDALALARSGGAVLWICNTIDAAQKQYRLFKQTVSDDFPLGLLHSRFPFWRRERLEDEWMARFGKDGETRCGSILVSTQVVEQSVDLDADLMITELAPTDMLLQRLGRLWRHERQGRPISAPKIYIIEESKTLEEFRNMEAEAIVETLGSKAHVYDPFILLRSLQLWETYPCVNVPSQIRELIEKTYRSRDDEPEFWEKLFDNRFVRDSNERFMAAMNSNYWQPHLPDEEGVQTRLNDMPTVPLVLCREIKNQQAEFLDGSTGQLGKDFFHFKTAQAVHRNLVKVPEYCFDLPIPQSSAFAAYLFGRQSAGIINDNGMVTANGLKSEYLLTYSDDLGLLIEKRT
jgi:CRISPR-associated endonuclease/helicase Cas3